MSTIHLNARLTPLSHPLAGRSRFATLAVADADQLAVDPGVLAGAVSES